MTLFITNLHGMAKASTAQIAQNLSASIAKSIGFEELGLYFFQSTSDTQSELSKRIDGIIASISFGDTVVFQVPTWNGIDFDEYFIHKIKLYSDLKLIIFIHDFPPLMFEGNRYLMDKYLNAYNQAKVVIVPSQTMADILVENGLKTKIIIQNMWDHPTTIPLYEKKFTKHIYFAGSAESFKFIENWNFNTKLSVFSEGESSNENVEFLGFKDDTYLMSNLNDGLGLVWPKDNQIKNDDEYYRMNASYKLSTYIAAGLPVIIDKENSNSKFVLDNKLGFLATTLDEVNEIIDKTTEEEYKQIAKNVKNFAELVRNGYFTKKALIDSIGLSILNEKESK
jgi:glycosyltransferase involved in cell wall biosynthesis